MMSSVDGRSVISRWTPPAYGVDPDLVPLTHEYCREQFAADGIILGRRAMEDFNGVDRAESSSGPSMARPHHNAGRDGRKIAVVMDPHGRLRYQCGEVDGSHVVVILSQAIADTYLEELKRRGVSYLFAGPLGTDLALALPLLRSEFGAELLLLEGGGKTNGAFLKAGFIDEISLLIYPGIDGLSGVPSIFEFLGKPNERPAKGISLRHLETRTLQGGVVWARYDVQRSPMPQSIEVDDGG